MAQSNNSAQGGIRGFIANNGNRTGNGFTRTLDRANVLPGMDERGNFSWREFRSDLGRTAANMVFPGLGSLIGMGRNNGWNLRNVGGAIRGTVGAVGTSIGRMFDGDPETGFFNNPTAPWNNTPANVPTGPLGPSGNLEPQDNRGNVDPNFGLGWVSDAASAPSQTPMDRNTSGFGRSADGRIYYQGSGRQITNLAGQLFNSRAPSHWRRTGTSDSWGTGGGLSNPWAMGDFFGSSGTIQGMHDKIR